MSAEPLEIGEPVRFSPKNKTEILKAGGIMALMLFKTIVRNPNFIFNTPGEVFGWADEETRNRRTERNDRDERLFHEKFGKFIIKHKIGSLEYQNYMRHILAVVSVEQAENEATPDALASVSRLQETAPTVEQIAAEVDSIPNWGQEEHPSE